MKGDLTPTQVAAKHLVLVANRLPGPALLEAFLAIYAHRLGRCDSDLDLIAIYSANRDLNRAVAGLEDERFAGTA